MQKVDQVANFDPNAQHSIGAQCNNCHAKLAAGAKFCAGCGKPVVATVAAAKQFCTGCGGQLVVGAKFCSGCGASAV
jgi:predicted amidophosphoribosyltransferase